MRIGKIQISRVQPERHDEIASLPAEERFDELRSAGKRLILGTLAARSGTRWLCDIVSNHPRTYAVTERDATVEAFWRYVKYNELPIDTDGTISLLKRRIASDWLNNDTTLIFSPYFSHGLHELCRALEPEKVIFGVAAPEFVVQSIYNKRLFVEDYTRGNTDLALGYQPRLADRWSHLFGRIVPRGDLYLPWEKLTRVGKIAWWVNQVNLDIFGQLQSLPESQVVLFDLPQADQKYDYYIGLAKRLDLSPLMTEDRFLSLKTLTVKQSDNVKHEWSAEERGEYELHIDEWRKLYDELAVRSRTV